MEEKEAEKGEFIQINGKFIAYAGVVLMLILLLFGSFGSLFADKINHSSDSSIASSDGSIPQACRLPTGQEVGAWKEHLGHHAETKYCLKYFS